MALQIPYTDKEGDNHAQAYARAYVMEMPKNNGQRLVSVKFDIFTDDTKTNIVGEPRFQFDADDEKPTYSQVYNYVKARSKEVDIAKGAYKSAQDAYGTADIDLIAAQKARSLLIDEEFNQLEGYDEARTDELAKLEVFESAEEVLKQSEVDYNALVSYELFKGSIDV